MYTCGRGAHASLSSTVQTGWCFTVQFIGMLFETRLPCVTATASAPFSLWRVICTQTDVDGIQYIVRDAIRVGQCMLLFLLSFQGSLCYSLCPCGVRDVFSSQVWVGVV